MKNFLKISGHVYYVKNQNGFINALYDYFCATDDGKDNTYSKQQVRKMIENFPESYPTNIVIIDQSFECGRVYIESFCLRQESYISRFANWILGKKIIKTQ